MRLHFGPVARLLIAKFGDASDVTAALTGSLVAGRWIEEEDEEFEAELEVFLQRLNDTDPAGLRQWADTTAERLRQQIARAANPAR